MIIYLPPQFNYLTREHIDIYNKDKNKSLIVTKKVSGVLYTYWTEEKADESDESDDHEEPDTDYINSKQKKKVSMKSSK